MTDQRGQLLREHVGQKWIGAPDEGADFAGQTLLTRDRAVIRAWAAARHAEPATGVGTVDIHDGGAAIRFAFPGVGRLRPLSWDDWFGNFDEYDLVFVYEEKTGDGLLSHKYRLVRSTDLTQFDVGPASAVDGHPSSWADGESSRRPPETPSAKTGGGWRRVLKMLGGGRNA